MVNLLYCISDGFDDFADYVNQALLGFIHHPNALREIADGNDVTAFRWPGTDELEIDSEPFTSFLNDQTVVEFQQEFWELGYYED